MPRIGLGLGLGVGGRRVWTPARLASLALQLQPTGSVYTDAARTTPATSGDPVGGWADRSTAAHHLDQTTSARRPIYYSSGLGGGARPRVFFDGTDDGLLMSGWGLGSGAQTVAMEFVRRSNVPTAQRLFSVRVAGPIFSAISLVNFGGYNEVTVLLGSAGGVSVGCNPTLGTSRHTLVVCYNGSGASTPANYVIYVDGVSQSVVVGGAFPDSAAMGALGSYSDASVPSFVDVGRVAAWSADHRASRLLIEGWLNA